MNYERWSTRFCEILHPAAGSLDMTNFVQTSSRRKKDRLPSTNSLMNGSKRSVVQTEVPGIATLLSYFSPHHEEPLSPFLVAHFMPSPFTDRGLKAMDTLPRVEMVYHFSKDKEGLPHIQFSNIRAVLATQELRVPLPHEAVDIRLERDTILPGTGSEAFPDPVIKDFTLTLQKSAREGKEALFGEPIITIKLPTWLAENRMNFGELRRDVEVEYLFERFEEVQVADFLPLRSPGIGGALDPEMSEVLAGMPEDMVLRYRDIEGGFVGGKRSELSLEYTRPPMPNLSQRTKLQPGAIALSVIDDGDSEVAIDIGSNEHSDLGRQLPEKARQKDLKLAETSLGLANALTRISARKLKPLRMVRDQDR